MDADSGSTTNSASSTGHRDVQVFPAAATDDDAMQDANIVWWDNDTDPRNPMNWSEPKKWTNICLVSFVCFVTPLDSFILVPGVPDILREFDTSSNFVASFVISVNVLGFAVGPLVIAPLSEVYGRSPVYHVGNVGFWVFNILCAVSNSVGMLMVCRFFSGVFAGPAMSIGGGTVGDLIPPERRGLAMAIRTIGPIIGPVVGPVSGGFLVEAAGWRWVFWLMTILAGVMTVACLFFLPETFPPVILARKAARLRKSTGNQALRSKLDNGTSPGDVLQRSILRPIKLLILSPTAALLALYIGVIYGMYFLLATTFTFVFQEQYGFSSGIIGLTYLGTGVGQLLAVVFCGPLSDYAVKKAKARNGTLKPEDRLPLWLIVPATACIPAGLFIYGWTVQHKTHWIIPLVGNAIFGYGLVCCVITVQTYLVDYFTLYAASAMAGNAVLRSLFGAFLPLAGLDMYDKFGLGWGNSLLAFITLALIPIPAIFSIFGERIRKRGTSWYRMD